MSSAIPGTVTLPFPLEATLKDSASTDKPEAWETVEATESSALIVGGMEVIVENSP